MAIPRTKGYTDIVKIAEAALNGDKEKAIKHIKAYLIKYPESDLVYPFSAILRGDLNPSGLHFCGQAEPVNDASALPIHSVSGMCECDEPIDAGSDKPDVFHKCSKCGKYID